MSCPFNARISGDANRQSAAARLRREGVGCPFRRRFRSGKGKKATPVAQDGDRCVDRALNAQWTRSREEDR
jgi:hypothetical protein